MSTPNWEISKITLFDQYNYTCKVGVGAVVVYGLRDGAIALSISHDSYSIITIGDKDVDIIHAKQKNDRTHGS